MTCINGEVLNHNHVSSSLNLIMFKILTRKLYIGPSMTYLCGDSLCLMNLDVSLFFLFFGCTDFQGRSQMKEFSKIQ